MQSRKQAPERWKENIRDFEEFKKGEEEFIESLKGCLPCLVKLSLELVESNKKEDRELLKKTLHEIARNIKTNEEAGDEEEGFLGLGLISATAMLAFLSGEPIRLARFRSRK